MSEMPPEFRPSVHDNYAESSQNVRWRFETDNLAEPYVDLEKKAILAVNLTDDMVVCDGGTAEGRLLQRLYVEFGFRGVGLGFDPNIAQFDNPISQPSDPTVAKTAIDRVLGLEFQGPMRDMLIRGLLEPPTSKMNLFEGRLSDIPFGDNIFDVMFVWGSLYHEDDLEKAFQEIKRTVSENGIVTIMTSGSGHKRVHRMLEQDIAEFFGCKAPKTMSASFNTAQGLVTLPQQFKNVFAYNHNVDMVVKNPREDNFYSLGVYLNSLRSMRDQFYPVPTKEQFEEALEKIVIPKIMKAIEKSESDQFVDVIERSIFIMSNGPFVPPADFVKLAPGA